VLFTAGGSITIDEAVERRQLEVDGSSFSRKSEMRSEYLCFAYYSFSICYHAKETTQRTSNDDNDYRTARARRETLLLHTFR